MEVKVDQEVMVEILLMDYWLEMVEVVEKEENQ
jgi:hypothetical protein